uniref:Acyl-coenzyme A oxidase n=1 Tax=Timema cristinae TaxID=61476 RepID=A0A7R9GWH7_TIMCR|nr:unnamed protein product [Timema cristinae]
MLERQVFPYAIGGQMESNSNRLPGPRSIPEFFFCSIDDKLVRVVKTKMSGSFMTRRIYFSTVLLAAANSGCRFLYVDLGSSGKESNATIFKKSSFSPERDSNLNLPVHGSLPQHETSALDNYSIEAEKLFLSDPELMDDVPAEYLSHKEKYELSIKKACKLFKKVSQLRDQGGGDMEMFKQMLSGMLGSAILKDGNPFALHYVMFVPTIMGQGTLEQQALWMGRAWNCEIIGTYAQISLQFENRLCGLVVISSGYGPRGPGFDSRCVQIIWEAVGLERWDIRPIMLLLLHNYTLMELVGAFIPLLFNCEMKIPINQCKIGEIGTKLGMNATNNGYLGFDKVRIPRENMLMKNAQVLEDGTYVKSPSDKLTYGTMMFVRVVIVQDVASYLSKAVTIAVRYSAVRRQSELKPGEPEPQIMDYRTQQYKLFPNIASCLAMRFAAMWLWNLYNNITSELEEGDMERLPELHALACCLKSVCSADGAKAIETCRLACGGHGYMTCSNLPATYGLVTAACTYEGENTVLLLQTARRRFLMKAWHQATSGIKLTPTVAYLQSAVTSDVSRHWEHSLQGIVRAHQDVAAGKIKLAATNMERRIRGGMSPEDAWNNTSIELTQCAESGNLPIFGILVYWENSTLDHMATKAGTSRDDINNLQIWLETLLAQIRPNAVSIVDSFDICDEVLSSALGARDGRVYERLFEEAAKSPLNKEPDCPKLKGKKQQNNSIRKANVAEASDDEFSLTVLTTLLGITTIC